jgi:protein phosphatase 2C family protein 2/3
LKQNGDLSPEDQVITANPDVFTHQIDENDEFLVLASDGKCKFMAHRIQLIFANKGISDHMSDSPLVDFIRCKVVEGKEPSEICGLICDDCLASDSADNMTIFIVAFLHGRTKEEWYSWIRHSEMEACKTDHFKFLMYWHAGVDIMYTPTSTGKMA